MNHPDGHPEPQPDPLQNEELTLPPGRDSSRSQSEDLTLPPTHQPSPTDESQVQTFGDYEILGEIARGGMGVVYRARQKRLNRIVALKMILSGRFASQEDIDRFYSEAESAATLDHPGIVPIYEIGKQSGNHYFSMKLIEGSNLGKEKARLHNDMYEAVTLMAKVCRAIHHAHQRGILHRDLKPANILIDKNDEPYLTDFGLARQVGQDSGLTQTGVAIGTPSYMAPEQAACESDLTTASDIYSVGAMLYELVAGRPPFVGGSSMETLFQVVNDDPVLLSELVKVDRSLELIVMKCLAKDPNERYSSAFALANDLERWLRGEPVSVTAPTVISILKVWLNQNFGRGVWLLIVGGTVGLVSGLTLWLATMQQTVGSKLAVYDALPGSTKPFTLFRFDTPDWLMLPLFALFACSIILLGFATAWFVRPKNRSADLAAGTIAGLIAGTMSFLVGFGAIGVISAISDNDLTHLISLAEHEDGTPLPDGLLATYPDLAQVPKDDQVRILSRKVEADLSLRVPWGILTGFLGSFALFFLAGTIETFFAGPIVRKNKTFARSILPYVETTFPMAALTIVFGIFFTAWLILGDSGILGSLPLYAMFAFVALAVSAKGFAWKPILRHSVFAVCLVLFVFFFVNDFPLVPAVGRDRYQLTKAEELAQSNPQNAGLQLKLGKNEIDFGNTLNALGRTDESLRYFNRAISRLDSLRENRSVGLDKVKRYRILVRKRKAAVLASEQQYNHAIQILSELAREFPNDSSVVAQLANLCYRSGSPEKLQVFLDSLESPDQAMWYDYRDLIGSVTVALGEHNLTKLETANEYFLDQCIRHLDRCKFPEVDIQKQEVKKLQTWKILGPHPDEDSNHIIDALLANERMFFDQDGPRRVNISVAPGLPINLRQTFGTQKGEVAFIATKIYSPKEQRIKMWVGSDNGVIVWVNMQRVFEEQLVRGYSARRDEIELALNKGENRIFIRTSQMIGDWRVSSQFFDEDGNPASIKWVYGDDESDE